MDLEDVDGGGNKRKVLNGLVEKRKRRKDWSQTSGTESERECHQLRTRKEEFKVLVKFMLEEASNAIVTERNGRKY